MNNTPALIFKRRIEWNQNADKYPDPCGAVGRPISGLEFSCLIADIKEKLHIGSVKNRELLLDIGCGNSFLLSHINNGMPSFGIDFSPSMIKKSQEAIPDAGFAVGETKELPFGDNVFDRILCYSVFHYFPDEEYAMKTVREMVRVCKKDGYIMIGDIPSSRHKERLTENELKSYGRQDRPGIHRMEEWLFYDLEVLLKTAEHLKCSAQILSQPEGLKTSRYRFDIVAIKNG